MLLPAGTMELVTVEEVVNELRSEGLTEEEIAAYFAEAFAGCE